MQAILNRPNIANAIRPKEWGPACWKFLDCLVFSYPLVPSEEQQAAMATYFHSLKNVLPCYSCRVDFTRMMEQDPIENHLHSRESLARWLHQKHNQVNEKLGKPTISFEHYVMQFDAPRATHQKSRSGASVLNTSATSAGNAAWTLLLLLGLVASLGGITYIVMLKKK